MSDTEEQTAQQPSAAAQQPCAAAQQPGTAAQQPGAAAQQLGASPQQPGAVAAAVSVQLPPYWPDDPVLWFAQVKAQFSTKGITSEKTMYHYVVSSLQPQYVTAVHDLLVSPPSSNPYKVLKSELTTRTTASEQRRLHQLLTTEELGNRTSTQLLWRMEQLLAGKTLGDSFFCQLFLTRLPLQVQSILASSRDSMMVHQLAELADKIIEVSSPPTPGLPISNVAASNLQSAPTQSPSSDDIRKLAEQVQHLTLQVQSLTKQLQQDRGRSPARFSGRDRSRGRSRGRNPANERQPKQHAGAECWYHWQYGEDAKNCSPPCSWQTKSRPPTPQGNAPTNE
ncbi:uncharacterized protein [Diadema antillarum]|uniref:uncharacterized protein n=1 Tax=Diadema antillarum TaxID=105358 RepID=UPI003A8AF6B1